MATKKLLLLTLLATLVVSTMTCGGGGEEEATPTPTPTPTPSPPVPTPTVTPVPPMPGEWTASVDFGEFVFIVNSAGTGISKISFSFSEFKCGAATLPGAVSVESPTLWTIADGQFTADADLTSADVTIRGRFDETGTHASGTWEIDASGTICLGEWESR